MVNSNKMYNFVRLVTMCHEEKKDTTNN